MKPNKNNGLTSSEPAMKNENLLVENDTHAKVNHILSTLIEIGWKDLCHNYFTHENSTDVDMDLIDWVLRGTIDDSCNKHFKKISAWFAILYESNLNQLVVYLQNSNGDINFTDETDQTILHVFLKECTGVLPKKTTFKVVKKLIDMGASVNAIDENHYTPLHIVAERKEKALIKLMLENFTNVTAASSFNGDTVLHDVVYACNDDKSYEDQYTNIVCTLLAKGASPNLPNANGITPMQCAVEYHLFEILLNFQVYGANFHQVTSDGQTLLHLACIKDKNSSSRLKIINLLVNQGCDVNAKDKNGVTPVHLAAKLRNEEIIQTFIQLGGDINLKTTNVYLTPLHLATSYNQPKNVEILLKAGANVNAEAKHGITPLHIAASRDGIKITKYLIKFGADVHRREKMFDFTPLHIAMSDCKKKVELLLKKGVDVNVTNQDGITPLHLASLIGNAKVVEVLVKHNADVNCRGSKLKLTPLHLASMNNNMADVKSLLFNDKDLRDKSLFDIFKWISIPTMNGDNVTVAELLIKNGTDVNVKDSIGRTPLHLATLQTTSKMIETLLKLGAYVDEYDDECKTPLRNVLESRVISGLNYLLKFGLDVNDDDVVTEFDLHGKRIVIPLLIHAMKLKMLGLPVHDDYNCTEDTHLEVEQLKSCMINGSDISVYDFLRMKPRRQVTLVKNVMNMNLEVDFPQYFNVIHAICRQAVNKVFLMGPSISALNQVCGIRWPYLCAEPILSFLNNRNLRVLIDSAKIDVM